MKVGWCFILISMTLLCQLALFVVLDNNHKIVVSELQAKIDAQDFEIEQLKKKQRITSQDVDFIQRLIIEGASND